MTTKIRGTRQIQGGTVDSAALEDTAVTPDTYGDATHVPQLTVDQDGRITDAAEVVISGSAPGGAAGGDLSGTYPNPSVVNDSHAHTSDTLTFDKSFALTGDITPTQLAANTNNWNPTGLSDTVLIRASTDASRNLTGLAGGADGRIVIIANVGSFNLVLKDEDANSTAGNRFALTADVTLTPDTVILLQYDSTSSRWRAIGGTGSGVSDGDKGDITVSSSGTVWTIDNGVVTFAKMQAITDGKLLGASGGTVVEEITVSTGLSLSSNNLSSTITQYTDEMAQDAVGNNVGTGLSYDDASGAISATGSGFVLNVNTTPVGNVGAGEDNLITYTVPANTLTVNGEFIQYNMSGIFAASINNKRVRVYFGSALLIDTGVLAITGAGDWAIEGYIIRTGSATQRCIAYITTNEAALVASSDYVDATEDLTGTVVLKATAEATSDNDIVQKFQIAVKGGGSTGGGESPTHSTMWADEFAAVGGTTITTSVDVNQRYATFTNNNSSADGDAFEITMELAAGSYTLYALGLTFSNHPKVDYSIDGSNVLTGQDWYSAGLVYNVVQSGAITVLTDGVHTFRITVNGKNGSSTNYLHGFTKVWIA